MSKPTTIDEFLAPLPEAQRDALETLRQQIRKLAPEAEERISYGIPCFYLDGQMLVGFGAAKRHCAFYPGVHPIEVHQAELTGYSVSKGTIRFLVARPTQTRLDAKPLPATLVRKLVKTRMAERRAGTDALGDRCDLFPSVS